MAGSFITQRRHSSPNVRALLGCFGIHQPQAHHSEQPRSTTQGAMTPMTLACFMHG
jgi:hypothetical protein